MATSLASSSDSSDSSEDENVLGQILQLGLTEALGMIIDIPKPKRTHKTRTRDRIRERGKKDGSDTAFKLQEATMEDEQQRKLIKGTLRRSAPCLFEDMLPIDAAFMSTFRKQEGIISNAQVRSIMAKEDPQMRLDKILEHVINDPIPRYVAFKEALKATAQNRIIGVLEKEQLAEPDGATKEPDDGKVDQFKEGDWAMVKSGLSAAKQKRLQKGHGGWNAKMKRMKGRIGKVIAVDDDGDCQVSFGGTDFLYNPRLLSKTDEMPISKGDKVTVSSDRAKVEKLQEGHGGWNSSMSKIIGNRGVVLGLDEYDDLRVCIDGKVWSLNHQVCTVLSRADPENFDPDFLEMLESYNKKSATVDPDHLIREVKRGNIGVVKSILARWPDRVNKVSNSGRTALHEASLAGQTDVVRVLLDAGSNFETKDDDGDTALMCAIFRKQAEVAELLLSRGADVDTMDKMGLHTLGVAVQRKSLQCVNVLLKYNVNLNFQDPFGDVPLFDAIQGRANDIVSALVKQPTLDFTVTNIKGFTPLQHAALRGHKRIMELILDHPGIKVDLQKKDGFTALHLAAFNDHVEVASLLITKGHADKEITNYSGQTPLSLAVQRGFLKMVRLLLELGADANAEDPDGDTCLHQAIMKWRISCIGLNDEQTQDGLAIATSLCKFGGDINRENRKGKTPISLVHDEVVRENLQQTYQNSVHHKGQRVEAIQRKFLDKGSDLFNNMAIIDEQFMRKYQQQEGIITTTQAQSLMAEQVPQRRLDFLLEHILSDPVPRYKAFLLALKETGQTRIIQNILEEQVPS